MEVAGREGDGPLLPPARHRCGAECIPAGCIHRAALPARTPAAGKALPPQRAVGLAAGSCLPGFGGGPNGNGGERHRVRVVMPWGPQPCQLLCVAAPAGCSWEAALVKQMLTCSPHLPAPRDNSRLA